MPPTRTQDPRVVTVREIEVHARHSRMPAATSAVMQAPRAEIAVHLRPRQRAAQRAAGLELAVERRMQQRRATSRLRVPAQVHHRSVAAVDGDVRAAVDHAHAVEFEAALAVGDRAAAGERLPAQLRRRVSTLAPSTGPSAENPRPSIRPVTSTLPAQVLAQHARRSSPRPSTVACQAWSPWNDRRPGPGEPCRAGRCRPCARR